jgi:hypothetical protein
MHLCPDSASIPFALLISFNRQVLLIYFSHSLSNLLLNVSAMRLTTLHASMAIWLLRSSSCVSEYLYLHEWVCLLNELSCFVVGFEVGEAYNFNKIERVHSQLPIDF